MFLNINGFVKVDEDLKYKVPGGVYAIGDVPDAELLQHIYVDRQSLRFVSSGILPLF
jgi:pyruvate/2-oxoglutarate dehydrogenase complex dihydrolipoamide dehydrogenase (E3) component